MIFFLHVTFTLPITLVLFLYFNNLFSEFWVVLNGFEKRTNSTMAAAGKHDVTPTSKDVISSCYGPLRKHLGRTIHICPVSFVAIASIF